MKVLHPLKDRSVAKSVDSTTMKKLNWPEFVELQTPEQLICYKENKMIELDSLTNFTKPVEKKRCDFGENMCFSYVAHVELEDEKFVQYAVRGCASKNATLVPDKPLYVQR